NHIAVPRGGRLNPGPSGCPGRRLSARGDCKDLFSNLPWQQLLHAIDGMLGDALEHTPSAADPSEALPAQADRVSHRKHERARARSPCERLSEQAKIQIAWAGTAELFACAILWQDQDPWSCRTVCDGRTRELRRPSTSEATNLLPNAPSVRLISFLRVAS